MLPGKNRLKKQNDFDNLARYGQSFSSDILILKKTANNLPENRVGFVVSKKISNKAVVRNKIKRRLREAIRKEMPAMKAGFDFAFFAKKNIIDKDFQQISQAIKNLLLKAGLKKWKKLF